MASGSLRAAPDDVAPGLLRSEPPPKDDREAELWEVVLKEQRALEALARQRPEDSRYVIEKLDELLKRHESRSRSRSEEEGGRER